MNRQRLSLLVLNDYLKFDRKIYQFMGFSFGRAIKVKTIVYFFLALATELLLFFVPVVSGFLKMLPEVFLLIVPFTVAYLLSDIATEGRSSVHYFRSVLQYTFRKQRKVTYCYGREIAKPTVYQFREVVTLNFAAVDPYYEKRALALEKAKVKEENRRQKRLAKMPKKKEAMPVLPAKVEEALLTPVLQPKEEPALTFRLREEE